MLSLNVLNPKKDGKVEGRTFNLFRLNDNTSILFDGADMLEPIIWATKGRMATLIHKLDEVMLGTDKDTKITIYTYKWTNNGWSLFCGVPWSGKVSDTMKKNW